MREKLCFWVLNHAPTDQQFKELQDAGYDDILLMPPDIGTLWSNVNPDTLVTAAEGVIEWITSTINAKGLNTDDVLVVIQGHNALVTYVVQALEASNITTAYAHSVRRSVEEVKPDGSVEKRSVFVHKGFYPYVLPDSVPLDIRRNARQRKNLNHGR